MATHRTTFQKRQKEMKRLEKQRAKAARRAERSLAKRAERETLHESTTESVAVLSDQPADNHSG